MTGALAKSNGDAKTSLRNFPYFSSASRYELGRCVSKSNTSCTERNDSWISERITVFRANALFLQSLHFERQDRSEDPFKKWLTHYSANEQTNISP
jgi:PIN domain nuclease of toxin-antitoxin system